MSLRKIIAFTFVLPAMVGAQELILPLAENFHRLHDATPQYDLHCATTEPILSGHNLVVGGYNRTEFTKIGSANRFIAFLDDSVSWGPVAVYGGGRIDTKGKEAVDMLWRDPSHGKLGYDIDQIVLRYDAGDHLTLKLGKDRVNWGPLALGGLLLSDYNPGFMMLHQEWRLGPFALEGIATQLNTISDTVDDVASPTPLATPVNTKRFLSAARLSFSVAALDIGIGQAVVYGGPNRNYEIAYLIPCFPFHYAQMGQFSANNNNYDNTFGSLDAALNLLEKRLRLYGEVLIDDIQGDTDADSQSKQNGIGWMAGAEGKTTHHDALIEGGCVNSFVYNHVAGERLQYVYNDAYIGSPVGPDAIVGFGRYRYRHNDKLSCSLNGWYSAHGERTLKVRELGSMLAGTRKDPVPYGTPTKTIALWVEPTYQINGGAIALAAGVRQDESKEKAAEVSPFARLTVTGAVGLRTLGE